MAGAEYRWGGEIRLADGDRPVVEGVALPYAPALATAVPDGPETAEPGCVTYHDYVLCNLQHDRTLVIGRMGRNLSFEDTPEGLNFRLELLPSTTTGKDALEYLRAGLITGASVEIDLLKHRRQDGVRVLEKVLLGGLALVDQPAFPDAKVSLARAAAQCARRRVRRRLI